MSKEFLLIELEAILEVCESGELVSKKQLQQLINSVTGIEKLTSKGKKKLVEQLVQESLMNIGSSVSQGKNSRGFSNLDIGSEEVLLEESNLGDLSSVTFRELRSNRNKESEDSSGSFGSTELDRRMYSSRGKMSLLKELNKYDCMEGTPISVHLQMLEEVFILEDIEDDRKKCSFLMLTVDLILRNYLDGLKNDIKCDWEELSNHLKERYPGDISVFSAKSRLKTVRIDMSANGFRKSALEMVKLYRIAYPKREDDEIMDKLQELCASSITIWNLLQNSQGKDLMQTITHIESILVSENKRMNLVKGRNGGNNGSGGSKVVCYLCKEMGHKAFNCKKGAKPESVINCFKCGQKGHYANKCTSMESKGSTGNTINAVSTDGANLDVKNKKCLGKRKENKYSDCELIKCDVMYDMKHKLKVMVDTGSVINMISPRAVERCGLVLQSTSFNICGIGGQKCLKAVTTIELMDETLEVYVGDIPVMDVDVLIGVDAVLNIGFDKLYNLSSRVKKVEESAMILNISEVVENSRVLEVDKNISSKNQEYSNDEILSMLMDKNPDVMEAISFGKNDIGKFKENVEEFEIDWKKASTEFIPYKFPEKLRDEAEKLIQELLETKTIIQGPAKLLHNVICVRKRNGELRACVDMRYSNKYMDKCQFPIPHLEQFLYKTRGFKYYSVLDLPSAYHQFYLAENQRNLLGIFFRGKTYAYQTLPQGCKNSPMFMQMKLSSLLDEDIIAWYYDDGIICSNNFEEHLEKLSIVLKKMVSVGLKISHSKSIFCAKSVDFLGNHLAEGLVITDGAKRTINSIKEPKTVSDVRALLGNLGFYSKYVPNYAKILYPVTQLLKKDVSFNWNTDCVEALKKIKKLVCSDVVLSRIQLNLPLIIQSDACERGYGVAVFQESSEGIRKPVLFWSMKRPHAIKYRNSVYLEGHSIICFIRKHYHLLLGMEILIETDNKPLSQAMTNQSLHPQLSAWAQELSFFQIVWKYIPKRENDIADILSRVEKSNEPTLEPNEVESLSLIQGGVSMLERVDDEVGLEVDGKNASELHGYESLNVILERNMKDELNVMNSSNDVFKEGKNSKFLLNENEEMKLLGNRNGFVGSITAIELKEQQRKWVDKHKPNNLVKRKNSDYWGIIDKEGKWIPLLTEELIDREARLLHSFGHFNWKKIAEIIKHRAYHPNLFKVVEMAVKNCEVCQKCNVKCKKIIKTNWCSYMLPRENYSADIMGPREGKYIIHIIDAATSFWMCAIISNCDGERIMMEVLKLCWRYGFPSTWRTDNAPYWNLTSKKLKECNCEVQTSNAYHHEGNTLAENAIGNLQHIMRKLLTEQIKNVQSIPLPLEEIVEWSVIFHNGVGIEGESPSELFLGHKLRIPSIFEEHSLNEVGTDMSRDVELLRLECLSKRSSKNMLNKIDRESKLSSKNGNMERVTQLSENYKNMNNNGSYLDELSGEKEIVRETVERGTSPMLENNKDSNEFFKVGDQVLASANWKKLQAKWEGPYLIQEINGSTAILTRPLIRGKRGRPPKTVVSRNLVQLKKFQEGDMF